jgi:AraC-like DNA-binding protein
MWEDLTPTLRFANFYDAAPGGSFGPRYIADFQLLFVQSGVGYAEVGATSADIGRGDVVFYGPNERHRVVSSKAAPLRLIGLHFVFRAEDASRLGPSTSLIRAAPLEEEVCAPPWPLQPTPPPVLSLPASSRFPRDCEELVLCFIAEPGGREWKKRGLLCLILDEWLETARRAVHQGKVSLPLTHVRAVEQAQTAILRNLSDPPLPARLAEDAGLSPAYFTRLFKQHTGQSLRDFLAQQRLLEARRLLTEGRLNVGEVSAAVGFQDPFYFSRCFSRVFGVSPSLFRHRYSLRSDT